MQFLPFPLLHNVSSLFNAYLQLGVRNWRLCWCFRLFLSFCTTSLSLFIHYYLLLTKFSISSTQFFTHVHIPQHGVSPEHERITTQTVHKTNSTLCRRASCSCGCAIKHLRLLTPNSRQRQRPSSSNNFGTGLPKFGAFQSTNQ